MKEYLLSKSLKFDEETFVKQISLKLGCGFCSTAWLFQSMPDAAH